VFIRDNAVPTILFLVWISAIVGVPVMLAWGWVRWARRKERLSLPAIFSAAGFTLATGSALLAIATSLYGQAIGGFPFYDARLLRMYRWGIFVSLSGTLLAFGGVWRSNPLRWQSLLSAFGTLVFWVLAATGE
jgi:hypothetical protein